VWTMPRPKTRARHENSATISGGGEAWVHHPPAKNPNSGPDQQLAFLGFAFPGGGHLARDTEVAHHEVVKKT